MRARGFPAKPIPRGTQGYNRPWWVAMQGNAPEPAAECALELHRQRQMEEHRQKKAAARALHDARQSETRAAKEQRRAVTESTYAEFFANYTPRFGRRRRAP